MAKVLKENSPPMIAFNKAEEILREAGINLDFQGGYLFLNIGKQQFRLKDLEGGEYTQNIPRFLDSERFVLDE